MTQTLVNGSFKERGELVIKTYHNPIRGDYLIHSETGIRIRNRYNSSESSKGDITLPLVILPYMTRGKLL